MDYTYTPYSVTRTTTVPGPTTETITVVDNVALRIEKISNDSGSFTPGKYRTNSYVVYSEGAELDQGTHEYESDNGAYKYKFVGNLLGATVDAHRSVSLPSSWDQLKLEAIQKAYAKLGSGDLGLGEDVAELGQTIRMLKRPLNALREFLTADSRANIKKLKKFLTYLTTGRFDSKTGKKAAKAASDAWLEFRYGWRPLIMLLGDLIEEVEAKGRAFDPDIIRCRVANVESTKYYDSFIDSYVLGGGRIYCDKSRVDTVRAHASVQYLQSNPLGLVANLGLSPRFWPETAWELTKLSFCVDWIISIGPWLEQFRVKPEVEILGNTVGMKLERKTTFQARSIKTPVNDAGPYGTPYTEKASNSFDYFQRYLDVKPPLKPVFRLGDVMDLFKTIDAIALILQRLFR